MSFDAEAKSRLHRVRIRALRSLGYWLSTTIVAGADSLADASTAIMVFPHPTSVAGGSPRKAVLAIEDGPCLIGGQRGIEPPQPEAAERVLSTHSSSSQSRRRSARPAPFMSSSSTRSALFGTAGASTIRAVPSASHTTPAYRADDFLADRKVWLPATDTDGAPTVRWQERLPRDDPLLLWAGSRDA